MSSLFNTQIKDTYQGLLKLANSTTGITSTLQAVEDGLGNNTGLRISTSQLESENIPSYIPLKSRYYGSGFANLTGTQTANGVQNTIVASPFYDNGNYSYSAVSINVTTQTSSSDTVEYAIYTSQMINPNGIFPYAPVVSGLTADTTTTGIKTFVLPSPLSFSGYGAGIYWIVWKISNSGVQPTVRFGSSQVTANLGQQIYQIYGINLGFTTNTYTGIMRANNAANSIQHFSGTTTFDNPYSTTLNATQSTLTTTAGNGLGILLHTIDA